MRNICDVIDEMVLFIPENENSLVRQLEKLRYYAGFSAPEMQSFWWNEVSSVLENYIPDIDEEWKIQIGIIFNGIGL